MGREHPERLVLRVRSAAPRRDQRLPNCPERWRCHPLLETEAEIQWYARIARSAFARRRNFSRRLIVLRMTKPHRAGHDAWDLVRRDDNRWPITGASRSAKRCTFAERTATVGAGCSVPAPNRRSPWNLPRCANCRRRRSSVSDAFAACARRCPGPAQRGCGCLRNYPAFARRPRAPRPPG